MGREGNSISENFKLGMLNWEDVVGLLMAILVIACMQNIVGRIIE